MRRDRARNAKLQTRQQKPRPGDVVSAMPAPSSSAPVQACDQNRLTHVAHLLSQPLTALRGSLELALLTEQEPAGLCRAVQEALELAEEMVRRVALLRELAEAETGVAEAGSVLVGELAAEVLDELRPLAESREIRLQMLKNKSTEVWAPRARLRQALLKIIYLVIQRQPGGRTVQVDLLRAGRKGCLEIHTDALRSCGSRIEFCPVVLPYDAVKESTSLEWFIAIQIIRTIGGTVLSDGAPAAARHFRIYLPLANPTRPLGS
jgi:C4-dicarboxylate-specific signal transduction histidine kinase